MPYDMQPIKTKVLRCSSNHEATKLCCNQLCRFPALCCREESCECAVVHSDCIYRQTSQLSKRIQNKLKLEEDVLERMFEVQKKFSNALFLARTQLCEQNKVRVQKCESQRLIFDLYDESRRNSLTAKEIIKLFNTISLAQIEKKGQECVKGYIQLGSRLIKDVISLRQRLYQKFCSGQSQQKEIIQKKSELIQVQIDSQLAEQSPQIGEIGMDSHILHKDLKGFSKFKYIMIELAYPVNFNLLFRASQHNFSSQKFHEFCDGYTDTLTIFKTQYDKTIAGFTKLPWSKAGEYGKDSAMSSFLLQLEWRQKMMLVAKTKAIFNHAKCGPTFGKDLVISDRCDQGQLNHSAYPKHYKYAYGKQFISASFSGAPKGEKFRVVEYEVYQVIK